MSAGGVDWREDGPALIELFLRACEEGPASETARDMTKIVLPDILGGLCRAFPSHVSAEAYGLAWMRMQQPAFRVADSPAAWLRFSVRKDLLAIVTANKEEIVTDSLDFWECPSGGGERGAGTVFDEMSELLVNGGWPVEVAQKAMAIIESRANLCMFTPNQMLKEMTCVPRVLRLELVDFVVATDGYVHGRLSGLSRRQLLENVSIQGYLSKLCVLPALV